MKKELRKGYEWVDCKTGGGYWKKITGQKHSHKLPLFCPYERCQKITGSYDDKFLLEYGVCATCFTMYIDCREKPVIDVEYYKKRYQERGY